MDLAECRALMGHTEWAESLVWQAVLALPQEDAELHLERLSGQCPLDEERQEGRQPPGRDESGTGDDACELRSNRVRHGGRGVYR